MPLYIQPCPPKATVWTPQEFQSLVYSGFYIDADGHALPMRDGLADPTWQVRPSQFAERWPPDATDVLWVDYP